MSFTVDFGNSSNNFSTTAAPEIPLDCFTTVADKASLIQYFNNNINSINEGYFEVKFRIVSSVAILVAVLLVFRHMVTAESRNIHIRNFLRSKGVDNDNTSSVVMQAPSTIAYNVAMWILRLTLFFVMLFPSTPAPSPYPRDFFGALFEPGLYSNSALAGNNLPNSCIFRPGWKGTTYVCIAQKCDAAAMDAGNENTRRQGGTFAPGSTYAQGRETACKICGDQFNLPIPFLVQQAIGRGYVFPTNCTGGNNNNNTNNNQNQSSTSSTTNQTCVPIIPTNPTDLNGSVGAIFYTTMHEDPIFGPCVIIGVCGAFLQVFLEWYFNKRFPTERRKLRAVSVTLLNFYDFVEQFQDPKIVFYKEYDWKFLIGGFLVQGVCFFAPIMYLFCSYPVVCMISFWPVPVLCVMATWDIVWLLFILVERKSDYEDLKWTDFDAQFQLLKISKIGEGASMIGAVGVSSPKVTTTTTTATTVNEETKPTSSNQEVKEQEQADEESLENEIKKIEQEEEETRLSQVRFPVDNSNNNNSDSHHQSLLSSSPDETSGNSQQQQKNKNVTSRLKSTLKTIVDAVSLPPESSNLSNGNNNNNDNNNSGTLFTRSSSNNNQQQHQHQVHDDGEEARKFLDATKILRLPTTLDELLPSTKPRTKKQCYEALAWIASTIFVPMALLKFIPGSAITPSVTVLFTVPFFFVALFWRTRNSFRLSANDDGTLTFYLVKVSSSGVSIFVDVTHGLLHGTCRVEFIYDDEYYQKNNVDKNEILLANFFVDHLKYELYLYPGSESKIRQQFEWLNIVVKNSHRDLYTAEKTTDVPRKQTADTRLSHLLSFLGRALQSEDILLLALRLDPNSQIAQSSLHAMTVAKVDPGSLSFDRRRGDQSRLGLRCLMWLMAFGTSFTALLMPDPNGNGIVSLERQVSGGGTSVCTLPTVEINGIFYPEGTNNKVVNEANPGDVKRFAMLLFPEIMYVEIFVYILLVAVHVDMIWRKRCVLESPLMIRLQAAGGILTALHWPTAVGFIVRVNLDSYHESGAVANHMMFELLPLVILQACRAWNALICPPLGLMFPLIS